MTMVRRQVSGCCTSVMGSCSGGTRNASVRVLIECLFADDGALVSSSRNSAESAIRSYQEVSSRYDLSGGLSKT